MRPFLLVGIFVLTGLLAVNLRAAGPAPADDSEPVYTPPEGEAPPVAPPVKPGSPLDHLAHDPKQDTPTVGYKEGHTQGDTYFIAHSFVDDAGGSGWGWVKKNGSSWGSAQWVALQEHPGVAVAPFRHLFKRDGDLNFEYKFWGHFAPYKAYDPHLDEELPVFVLEGYEVIGLGNPLSLKVGAPNRITHKGSGASSRSNRPILTDPSVD